MARDGNIGLIVNELGHLMLFRSLRIFTHIDDVSILVNLFVDDKVLTQNATRRLHYNWGDLIKKLLLLLGQQEMLRFGSDGVL